MLIWLWLVPWSSGNSQKKKYISCILSPFVCAGSAKPQISIGQWVVCAIPAKPQKSMGQWVNVPAKFLEPGGCWTSNPAEHRVGPGVEHQHHHQHQARKKRRAEDAELDWRTLKQGLLSGFLMPGPCTSRGY